MKLWLDDVRPMPRGFDLCAKTVDEAIAILEQHQISFASLDHDINWDDCEDVPPDWDRTKTGYAVVLWMESHDVWPLDGVAVHSANPPGAARMRAVIERHYGRIFD